MSSEGRRYQLLASRDIAMRHMLPDLKLLLVCPPRQDACTLGDWTGRVCRCAIDRASTNAGVSGQAVNVLFVLIRQLVDGELILLLLHVVGLDDGAEYGEAVLDIQRGIIAVGVDSCHSQELLALSLGRFEQHAAAHRNLAYLF